MRNHPKIKVIILISGRGSNMEAIINACDRKDFPAYVDLVIADRQSAAGLQKAQSSGIETKVIEKKSRSQSAFETEIDQQLEKHQPDLVCLAGFMRILSPEFTQKWHGRLINIHPSLLPSFKGIHAQKQAYDKGVKITGCTVHFVTADLDDGPIIAQKAVPVKNGDNVEILSNRILEAEHICYVEALETLANQLLAEPQKKVG